MTSRTFVIRRAFVASLGLLLLLLLALMAVSLQQGQPLAKVLFLLVFALPVAVLLGASALRRIEVDEEGITSRRPGGSRRILFVAVTALEAVRVRSRVFITLSAGDDNYLIISNGYAGFPELVALLIERLPAAVVEEEVRSLAASPVRRYGDLVTVWFAITAVAYVLLAQFR